MDLEKVQHNKIKSPSASDRDGLGLKARDPEKYQAVIDMLKAGETVTAIRERLKPISRNTITAIRDENNLDADWRRHTAAKLKRVVAMVSDRLDEEVDNIPVGQLPIAGAVLIDQVAKLENRPVAIIRHESANTHSDLNDRLAALEAEVIVDAEVISEDNSACEPTRNQTQQQDGVA